ncbi:hypothetical protein [Halostagnicola sp. A-GB9-2]|uniref:hypothetical protein n=1 Tax=Halostagnicola sp. A-GB9-2 TaxID=3048066 RepID=UPI0024BF5290|nr:hypothetical protein [Halostagnicola sp. A-GB9-2]MDJ1432778.1 hypothetical protein [Halostagnicola sp. A-GB9-2]
METKGVRCGLEGKQRGSDRGNSPNREADFDRSRRRLAEVLIGEGNHPNGDVDAARSDLAWDDVHPVDERTAVTAGVIANEIDTRPSLRYAGFRRESTRKSWQTLRQTASNSARIRPPHRPLVRRRDRLRPAGALLSSAVEADTPILEVGVVDYSDGTGGFGWHHHPQEHVEGWGQFQERSDSETAYTYESYAFSSKNPTRVVWEAMSRLTSKLEAE